MKIIIIAAIFAAWTVNAELMLQLTRGTWERSQTGVEMYRIMIARDNLKFIEEHNKNGEMTFEMAPYSQFIALSADQVRSRYFFHSSIDFDATVFANKKKLEVTKPDYINQFNATFVDLTASLKTPVQDQGQCGNSYAISAIDAVNMANRKSNSRFPLLSAQHLTDCSKGYYSNSGCKGGWIYESMEYLTLFGVYSLETYPRNSQTLLYGADQPCKTISGATKYYISSWHYFDGSSCEQRINYLLQGHPITIGLAGGNPYFWYYKSGILNECYGYSKVDHAAVLVGAYYDLQNLQGSYLKIKNSWGSNWGEEGNVRISLQGGVCSACQYGAFAYQ